MVLTYGQHPDGVDGELVGLGVAHLDGLYAVSLRIGKKRGRGIKSCLVFERKEERKGRKENGQHFRHGKKG